MKNRNLNNSDDWETPENLYTELDKEFNFDFDPCPFQHDIEQWDGLEIEWGQSNFVNPGYSRKVKEAFIRKGYAEWEKGKNVVFLIPVSTSTGIFHEIIYPEFKARNCEIRFLKGRVKFKGVNTFGELVTDKCGMHDSMLVIFRK